MNQPLINVGSPSISPTQARQLVERVIRISGVRSGSDRPEFVRTRLSKRLLHLDCSTFEEYLTILNGPGGRSEELHLVEALTTHTTSFFREDAHFEWMSEHAIPDLLSRGTGIGSDLAIWSAAVSTGAELWSAAMKLEEFQNMTGRIVRYKLIGTDISRPVLAQAAKATFSETEIKGIPEILRSKYLLRTPKGFSGEPRFKIIPRLQTRARLAFANLLDLSSGPQINADIVLLRNVLIYFDRDTQAAVARAVFNRMRPGGYLFIGHTESLRDVVPMLEPVGSSIYQKVIV